MIKEESDFHDLESVVQQVEQNLELMTVRSGVVGRAGLLLQESTCYCCQSPQLDPELSRRLSPC